MNHSSVFLDQETSINYHYPIQYDDNINDDDYVTQFLNSFEDHDHREDETKTFSSLSSGKTSQMNVMEDQQIQSFGFIVEDEEKKKPSFHNFQKHLVITLRSIIRLKKGEDKVEGFNTAVKMWKLFYESKKYNKALLCLLFGSINEDDEDKQSMFYQYGFGEIIERYPIYIICKAQNYLRKQVLKQLNSINMEQYISKRRMKKKIQFTQYFKSFMQEMEEGAVTIRISKQKTLMLSQSQHSMQLQQQLR